MSETGQGRGVCCHHDLGPGGGGHTDICGVGDALWQRMMAAIQFHYDAFGDGPLPDFALHGAPGPHQIETPPYVVGEPSHGGAARNEAGDRIDHPTASGFAAHSIAALQGDLNTLGAQPPLQVDGGFGPATQKALRSFQITHGLTGDGLIGPASWAAIDAALAKKAA